MSDHQRAIEGSMSDAHQQIRAHLAAMKSIADGWCDGDGTAYDPAELDLLGDLLCAAVDEGCPPPFIYPDPDGTVRVEWSFADAEVSADFNVNERSVLLHGLVLSTDKVRELTLRGPSREWATIAGDVARFVMSFAAGNR